MLGFDPIVQLSSTFDTVEMVAQPVTAAAAGFAIFFPDMFGAWWHLRPGALSAGDLDPMSDSATSLSI